MKRCGRRCHRFRHPRAQTTPHHSIIHAPKMIVYLAPNIFQFSKGGHRLPPYTRHRFRHPRAQTTPHHSIIHPPQIPVHHPALDKIQISIFYGVTASHPSTTHAHDANNHPSPQYTSQTFADPLLIWGKSER